MSDYAWVSFATDEDGPLGVVFTKLLPEEQGDDRMAALLFVQRLHRQGVNPGGEVQWMAAPEATWRERSGEHWSWLLEHADQLIAPLALVEQGYLTLADFGPEGRAMIERQLGELADPDTGIQHDDGECTVCDRARAASRILQEQADGA